LIEKILLPKNILNYILVILTFFSASGYCQKDDNKVKLVFTFHQERDIYDKSTFGEPPQFAIWLEAVDSKKITTVFVTNKTGTGDFEGKIECPVSLPVWIGAFRQEAGRDDFPRPWEPFYDGITGATPKNEEIEISVEVQKDVSWFYYLEMNVAGDYNKSYPYISSKKKIDNHGNGQPSLIYKGEIVTQIGETSMPILIGRSEQHYFTTQINPELEGIDLAKEVFLNIVAECK
jgi:hypothetical protein